MGVAFVDSAGLHYYELKLTATSGFALLYPRRCLQLAATGSFAIC